MPKYRICGQVTISIYTEVEASDPATALEAAEAREMPRLCHQCGGSDSVGEEWATSGELDGSPEKLRVDGEVEE